METGIVFINISREYSNKNARNVGRREKERERRGGKQEKIKRETRNPLNKLRESLMTNGS